MIRPFAVAVFWAGFAASAYAERCRPTTSEPAWWLQSFGPYDGLQPDIQLGDVLLFGTFESLDDRKLEHEVDYKQRWKRRGRESNVRTAYEAAYRYNRLVKFSGVQVIRGKVESLETDDTVVEFTIVLNSSLYRGSVPTGKSLATIASRNGSRLKLKPRICQRNYTEMTPDDFTRLLECVNDARC